MSDVLKRLLLWAVIVLALYGASNFFDAEDFSGPRRPVPPEEGGGAWLKTEPALPPSGRTASEAFMEMTIEESSHDGDDVIGTAFLVAPNVWVTAAHVLEECTTAYVRIQSRWRQAGETAKHPSADVAILKTSARERPPVLGVTDRLPVIDQDGFHVGFPQGVPSTVYSRFIGLTRIRAGRPGTPLEQGWAWVEQDRQPTTTGTLGGLSGGPQVDRTGAVQGVTILHAERTGQIVTTPTRRVCEVVPETVPHAETGGAASAEPTSRGTASRLVRSGQWRWFSARRRETRVRGDKTCK